MATPIRTCVGCRRTAPSTELIRFRLDGEIHTGPGSGRGAWLCRVSLAACAGAAVGNGGFQRAFRSRLDAAVLDRFLTDAVAGRFDRAS